ncbi:hypothetical protein BLA29_012875 [Euroglyphus maynei]|uniref:Uncharacterized protein n=1 Tax=Euroglyphus maynei TaxID=6958 RepID=A0A1Y3BVS0_EURMA|nr:hypothetical protein BLA29_012875 [Euroglyphus maynei]
MVIHQLIINIVVHHHRSKHIRWRKKFTIMSSKQNR